MAGLGEAASIAGLIAVAGQCADLVIKSIDLVREYREVSSNAQGVVDELELLHGCITHIQDLSQRAQGVIPDASDAMQGLNRSLTACRDAMGKVEQQVSHMCPKNRPSVLKKLNVAARRDFFTKIQAGIVGAKQELTLKLEVLDCELNIQTAAQIKGLTTSARSIENEVTSLVQDLSQHSGATHRSFESLEQRLQNMQRLLEFPVRDQKPSVVALRPKRKPRRPYRISLQAKTLERVGRDGWNSTPSVQQSFIRLVTEAWLVYPKNGTQHWQPTTREITSMEQLEASQRLGMIRYVQNLRVLLWLFRLDNFILGTNVSEQMVNTICALTGQRGSGDLASSLTRQASVTSLWEFDIALVELERLTGTHPAFLDLELPLLHYILLLEYAIGGIDKDRDLELAYVRHLSEKFRRVRIPDEQQTGDTLPLLQRLCLSLLIGVFIRKRAWPYVPQEPMSLNLGPLLPNLYAVKVGDSPS